MHTISYLLVHDFIIIIISGAMFLQLRQRCYYLFWGFLFAILSSEYAVYSEYIPRNINSWVIAIIYFPLIIAAIDLMITIKKKSVIK
jgi:hypothetical protein